jgi:hypothetical protein
MNFKKTYINDGEYIFALASILDTNSDKYFRNMRVTVNHKVQLMYGIFRRIYWELDFCSS